MFFISYYHVHKKGQKKQPPQDKKNLKKRAPYSYTKLSIKPPDIFDVKIKAGEIRTLAGFVRDDSTWSHYFRGAKNHIIHGLERKRNDFSPLRFTFGRVGPKVECECRIS